MVIARASWTRSASALLCVVVAAATLTAVTQAPAQAAELDLPDGTVVHRADIGRGWNFNGSESCLMRKINRARNRHGMRSLNWDKQLGFVARGHAQDMAGSGGIWHDGNLGEKVTRWRRIGQNTGRGGRCKRIFRSFIRSSSHRANIFGGWRFIGVGAEWRSGSLYVQQVFESRRDPGNVYHYP